MIPWDYRVTQVAEQVANLVDEWMRQPFRLLSRELPVVLE
jgi:hypothetical protein